MKQKLPVYLAVGLLVLSLVFFGLWQKEKRDRSQMEQFCQASASLSLASFEEYRDTGRESDYWYAVSDFRAFQQSYHLLVEDTSQNSNFLFCNEVYGTMVLFPGRAQAHMDELIGAMALLSNDIYDQNGYLRLADLRNNMQE